VWDWRLGDLVPGDARLAQVVSAASAFVPMVSPLALTCEVCDPVSPIDGDTAGSRYTALLTNGAVLDPLAVEAVWTRSRHLVVVDGGGSIPDSVPKAEWFQHTDEVLRVMHEQARHAQRARLHDALADDVGPRSCTYCCMEERVWSEGPDPGRKASRDSTRFVALAPASQQEFIDLGYAGIVEQERRRSFSLFGYLQQAKSFLSREQPASTCGPHPRR
jgi:NTE family protein